MNTSAEEPPSLRTFRVLPIHGVFLLALLVYCLPHNAFFYFDSLVFAMFTEQGEWPQRLHPHHLGYMPIVWLLWQSLRTLGISLSPLTVMAVLSRVSGLASIAVAAQLFRRSGFSEWWIAQSAALFAVTWFLWLDSVTPTVYPLALVCLLLVYRELDEWTRTGFTTASLGRVALWYFFAILWHQLAALVIVPIIVWGVITARRADTKFPWSTAGVQLLAPICETYFLCGIAVQHSLDPREVLRWVTLYAHHSVYWWWIRIPKGASPLGFWLSLMAQSHASLFWALPYEDAQWRAHAASLRDPFASGWQTMWSPYLMGFIAVLLTMLLVWTLVAGGILWRRSEKDRDRLKLALLWSGPFILFSALYQPEDGWFRLYYLFPLLWVVLSPAATSARRTTEVAGFVLASLALLFAFGTNYAYGYAMWCHPEDNPLRQDAPKLDALPPGDLVFGDYQVWNCPPSAYARNFSKRVVYAAELITPSEVDEPKPLTTLISESADRLGPTPPQLFLDHILSVELEENRQSGKVFHLGWLLGDHPEPRELWIPESQLRHLGSLPPIGQFAFDVYEIEPGASTD